MYGKGRRADRGPGTDRLRPGAERRPATTRPAPVKTAVKAPPAPAAVSAPADIRSATCYVAPDSPPAAAYSVLSCDSTNILSDAKWSAWNETVADGIGKLALNDCEPDCARGTFTHYPVSIHYEQPIRTQCGMIWSHATVTFLTKPPVSAAVSYPHGKPAFVYVTNHLLHC
jgi:hypothetical protein